MMHGLKMSLIEGHNWQQLHTIDLLLHNVMLKKLQLNLRGRDKEFGIGNRYGLDGLGIESRWGQVFPHPSRPALGLAQPPIQWVVGLFRGKAAGPWR